MMGSCGGLRAATRMLGLAALAALLAGCATDGTGAPPPEGGAIASVAPTVPLDGLIGRWGIGSYLRDQDKARTETIARQQCGNPYTITRGPTGGIMMHLPDQQQVSELRLKGAPGGRNFIGPEGPPGGELDREIVAFAPQMMSLRFVDPENAKRFGTMVYAKCR